MLQKVKELCILGNQITNTFPQPAGPITSCAYRGILNFLVFVYKTSKIQKLWFSTNNFALYLKWLHCLHSFYFYLIHKEIYLAIPLHKVQHPCLPNNNNNIVYLSIAPFMIYDYHRGALQVTTNQRCFFRHTRRQFLPQKRGHSKHNRLVNSIATVT